MTNISIGTITVYVDSPDESLKKFASEIFVAAEEVLLKVIEAIRADSIEIFIVVNPSGAVPETGIGGNTETPHRIRVSLDLKNKHLRNNLRKEIRSTIAHEIHHAMRNRIYPWPGTLLEDVVSEGLADHFDLEVNRGNPRPWDVALSAQQLRELLQKAEPFLQKNGNGYPEWMFGSEKEGIPRWAGYSLGFTLVSEYIRRTGKKASELIATDPNEFIQNKQKDVYRGNRTNFIS